jgi:hypothetical protein
MRSRNLNVASISPSPPYRFWRSWPTCARISGVNQLYLTEDDHIPVAPGEGRRSSHLTVDAQVAVEDDPLKPRQVLC